MEIAAELVHLDRLELRDPVDRTHDLDPAAVHAGLNAVDLVEAVVSVLLFPERPGDGIEGHPEAVANPIREDLLNVGA